MLRRPLAAAVASALMVLACAAPPARAAQSHAYVVTTDFNTGGVSSIALSTRAVAKDVASVYRDARARWFGGLLYVVNRFGQDNVQVIDPAAGFATIHQYSVGNGSNPSDIIVVSSTKAYVSLYQRPQLAILNPATGASLGTIDLAPFADADGIPEADHMARFGRWLFVSLQRLDEAHNFVPTDTSLVAVIDVAADTVVDVDPSHAGTQAIVLSRTNPVTSFAWDPVGRVFYLGCSGAFRVSDGGIVRIDPETFTDTGVAVTEATLGGDLADVEWHTATHSYAIVTDASFNATLVSWNPTTGVRIAPVFGPNSGLADCALDDRGELYVCDNSFGSSGVRVFDAATDAVLAGPLDTGLPPYQVVFDSLTPDVLDVPTPTSALALSPPAPNPARDHVTARFGLARAADVTAAVFDLSGRRVRMLIREHLASGMHELRWDLHGDRDARLAPGVYLLRLRADARETVRRVTVLN